MGNHPRFPFFLTGRPPNKNVITEANLLCRRALIDHPSDHIMCLQIPIKIEKIWIPLKQPIRHERRLYAPVHDVIFDTDQQDLYSQVQEPSLL
jgi:hypothetical protein